MDPRRVHRITPKPVIIRVGRRPSGPRAASSRSVGLSMVATVGYVLFVVGSFAFFSKEHAGELKRLKGSIIKVIGNSDK